VWFAQFSSKGDKVVTASLDYTAKIWSSNGPLIATLWQSPKETLVHLHKFHGKSLTMLNIFEALLEIPAVRKFRIGDLLFAEVTCPLEDGWTAQWAHVDHIIHVLTGRKTLRTRTGTWVAKPGDTFFLKKGVYLTHFEQDTDMCLLVFFIPDECVRAVVKEVSRHVRAAVESMEDRQASVIKVNSDITLEAFLQAMAVFFAGTEEPPELVLRLKLKELITSMLVSAQNRELAAYFRRVATSPRLPFPRSWKRTVVTISPARFAKMCHRSLSSFKRDFHQIYGPLCRWLLERRLERAAHLLRNTSMSITEVVFECGFENASHFCRAFKKLRRSPSVFREPVPSGFRNGLQPRLFHPAPEELLSQFLRFQRSGASSSVIPACL
jgi:AraC-like DNA-binding protein